MGRTRGCETAVEVLNELGGLAELEERDGAVVIRGYSCPLAGVTPDHPEVCRMAEAYGSRGCGRDRPRALRPWREASLLLRGSVCRRRRANVTEAGTTSSGTAEILRRRASGCLLQTVERAEDGAVDEVSQDHRNRRAAPIVHGHEARWL